MLVTHFICFSLILLMGAHFVADYLLQTKFQKYNKHHDAIALLGHTTSYSIFMGFVYSLIFISFLGGIIAAVAIFVMHTATDIVTSNMIKKAMDKGDKDRAVVIMGMDQLLHTVQIIFIYTIGVGYLLQYLSTL